MRELLTVVIPAYNEEKMIAKTSSTITGILKDANIPYELIFVDDGSKDGTWGCIEEETAKDPQVKGLHFSRNFGKESAIFAGLSHANGECTVVIDCDLQHPPVKIVEMYELWEQGYEIVEAVKSDRGKESALHRLCAKCFYSIMSKATNIDMRRASDFKLLDKKAVLVLINMKEKNSFFRALSSWIGFKTTKIEFEVQERTEGETKWSTRSLIKYAIINMTSFSTAPMQVVTILGIILFVVSVVLSVITLVQKIMGIAVEGFTTIIIFQAFSSSIIMIGLGIIGFYISKIYEEMKDRPKFIVSKVSGELEQK